MIKAHTIVVLLLTGLLACNSEDPFLPLTPELVEEIKSYDLDNNCNSSDIRFEFEVKNNLNVEEYRVMFVPLEISSSFNLEIAHSIPRPNYLELFPESFKIAYSFDRLPAELLDVNGGLIQNGREYVAVVYIVGEDEANLL